MLHTDRQTDPQTKRVLEEHSLLKRLHGLAVDSLSLFLTSMINVNNTFRMVYLGGMQYQNFDSPKCR